MRPAPEPTRKRHIAAAGAALMWAACAALGGCESQAKPVAAEPAPQPVEVVHPAPAAAAEPVRGVGRLLASHEMHLGFTSAGTVARIAVDIGDRVHKGQVLATLDMVALDAAVEVARQQYERAQRDWTRAQPLRAAGAISREASDNYATERDTTAAQLRAAEFARRYGEIVAPADGTVLARPVEPREVVEAGQTVLIVSSEDRGWRFRMDVPDRDLGRIAIGAPAQLALDPWPGNAIGAHVSRISTHGREGSGVFEVEIAPDDTDLPLRSGLIGHAAIRPQDDGRTVLTVPVAALVEADGERAAIMLVKGGHAQRQPVRLGLIDAGSGMVEVRSGLSADDAVIVSGGAWVDNGSPVTIVSD